MKRREGNELSLAFLDVICCGFGAIILLLMITKISLPTILEVSLEEIAAQIAKRQEELEKILGETTILEETKVESEEDLETELLRIAKLQEELLELTSRYETVLKLTETQEAETADLSRAKQTLTDEMIRLLGTDHVRSTNTIGGIQVDSEYIIFVIDTSGSMQVSAWPAVVQKVQEVLNVYPVVKGIQVMNDMGDYMFPRFRGKWIDDTPTLRRLIVDTLKSWTINSNSSPVEGIEEAINTYYDPNKNISIYVFGDDFRGTGNRAVEDVVDRVSLVNSREEDGDCRVRIHAVGFPVYIELRQTPMPYTLFSMLMRELTKKNCGTFVGLPSLN